MKNLNTKQLEVVNHIAGPALVIAGPGTGKTTSIAYRINNLIENGVSPESILLLTFTRKAAKEMRDKVAALINNFQVSKRIVAGTFHSVCIAIMKKYGLFQNLTIIDKSDEEVVIQKIKSQINLVHNSYSLPMRNDKIIKIFSLHQSKRIPLLQVLLQYGELDDLKHVHTLDELLSLYKRFKIQNRMITFDDILDLFYYHLTTNPNLLISLQNTFNYFLVDEYQDTNLVQSDIIRLLSEKTQNLMVVGDDSQSIYSFRGADIQNILNFESQYNNVKIIKLEENYRSTPEILKVVNNVNDYMIDGYKKSLYSSKPNNQKAKLVRCNSVISEAEYIANQIIFHRENGINLKNMAVIYNKSDNAKQIEFELMRRGIKYKKVGGIKIAEKSHVKDVISYLKLMINPSDSLAWGRIINYIHGVGEKKLPEIINGACKYTVFNFCRDMNNNLANKLYSTQTLFSILSGLNRVDSMIEVISEHYKAIASLRNNDDNTKRIYSDLEFLKGLAVGFYDIDSFLTEFALNTSELTGIQESINKDTDEVLLSTIHSVKGLEFNVVFIPHLLNGVFPNKIDDENINEIHRLFYVAVSRAKESLYITYPTYKETWENFAFYEPSLFLKYINIDDIENIEHISIMDNGIINTDTQKIHM